MTTLTQQEYQQKIAELKTPEEITAFVKDYQIAPSEELEEVPAKPGRKRKFADLPGPSSEESWKDVAGNETEEKIIALYAKGLTTRDIMNYLKEHHKTEVSQAMISNITDKLYPLIKEWQTRPLSPTYAFLYLDGLRFKVRDAGKIVNKCAYIILGISSLGYKEVLGVWIAETESAKFWMQILNELKNRGVDDILIASIDGLRGFPEAIQTIFPHDASLEKLLWLAQDDVAKRWRKALRNWGEIVPQLAILFPEKLEL